MIKFVFKIQPTMYLVAASFEHMYYSVNIYWMESENYPCWTIVGHTMIFNESKVLSASNGCFVKKKTIFSHMLVEFVSPLVASCTGL